MNAEPWYDDGESVVYYLFETGKWSFEWHTILRYGVMDMLRNCAYVVSDDGKFLIIFGEYEILVMNIQNSGRFETYRSKIKCPKGFKPRFAVLSGEEIMHRHSLIFGYYRSCWIGDDDNNKIMPIVPLEIVNIICCMYGKEIFIHVFSKRRHPKKTVSQRSRIMGHFKINAERVLYR